MGCSSGRRGRLEHLAGADRRDGEGEAHQRLHLRGAAVPAAPTTTPTTSSSRRGLERARRTRSPPHPQTQQELNDGSSASSQISPSAPSGSAGCRCRSRDGRAEPIGGDDRRGARRSWTRNGDPAYLKEAAKASARRLGVDAIGLYHSTGRSPKVPYAESDDAPVELLDEASSCAPGSRTPPTARSTRPTRCSAAARVGAEPVLAGVRSSRGAGRPGARGEPQQVTLAWELSLAEVVIPIPGASRPAS